jgi:TolB-like protein/Flp pilus assembly protein TadD
LAVLPFKALASSENDESLALGMADALITRLATVHGLIVRPTSSVMKYAQGGVDILAAGRQLQVDALVDGRFQLVGDRVRVTVQLMNLADGSSIWADAFDEPFKDVFAVQDRISQRVAEALVANLTPEDRGRLARRDTQNTEAYRLYVRGRYFWERRTSESLHKSLEYYGQAIALDPSYGLAYAGMADSYNILGNFGLLAPRDAYPKAKTAAQQALTLDAHLSQARIAVAFATYLYDRDWNAAESGFKRALAEAPNYGPGHQWYAVCLVSRGRFDEALAEIRRAVEVDPTSLVINAVEAWVSFLARRYDAAIADAKRTLEMDADFVLAYEYLALTYAAQGKYEEALMEMRRFKSYSPATYDRDVGVVGLGLARTGRLEDARRTLDDLKALTRERYVSPYSEALIRIGLGEKAQAIALLERAADERYPWAIHFNIDPLLDPVRDDPRFIALRRRIGLPAVPIPVGN